MSKISKFCRICGIFCLLQSSLTFAEDIGLPPPPTPAAPPTLPKSKDPEAQRQHHHDEKKIETDQQAKASAEQQEQEKQDNLLKEDEKKPRPLRAFVELSLVIPKGVVSKGRTHYLYDPTTHINIYGRPFSGDPAQGVLLWLGLRLAALNGYGTQDNLTARFSHSWIGPSIGLGKISEPGRAEGEGEGEASIEPTTRTLWMVSTGVAGISRLSDKSETPKPAPSDFKSSPWAFDPPGLWLETRWTRVAPSGFGYGLLGGLQLGTGKEIYYGGLTISGFY